MRRTRDGILTKWQAVLVAVLTGVFYLLILAVFDHAGDGKTWGDAVGSNIFGALFLMVWMSVFFYFWPRWMAKRKKADS